MSAGAPFSICRASEELLANEVKIRPSTTVCYESITSVTASVRLAAANTHTSSAFVFPVDT